MDIQIATFKPLFLPVLSRRQQLQPCYLSPLGLPASGERAGRIMYLTPCPRVDCKILRGAPNCLELLPRHRNGMRRVPARNGRNRDTCSRSPVSTAFPHKLLFR